MGLKRELKRYIRGGVFAAKSIFWEKPRGLDFSMRQKTIGIKAEGNHGYALTPKKAFDNMILRLDISASDKFIDIGCGKGGVLYFASKCPFGRVAGIEIEDSLYKIAVRNFQRLNTSNVELIRGNAVTFDKYNEFNVFFIANPFDSDIYQKVVDSILNTLNASRNDSRVYLVCYGATITEYIRGKNLLEHIDNYTDRNGGREVNIWRWKRRD